MIARIYASLTINYMRILWIVRCCEWCSNGSKYDNNATGCKSANVCGAAVSKSSCVWTANNTCAVATYVVAAYVVVFPRIKGP